MTWMDVYLLLESMKNAGHTSLCDTPAELVSAVVDGELCFLDLVESMTTGKIVFIQTFNAMDGAGDDD